MIAEILLYVGTLFIGFEITRMVGVFNMPIVLPFVILFYRLLMPMLTFSRNKKGIYKVFWPLVRISLVIFGLIMIVVGFFCVFLMLISWTIFILDAIPNLIYKRIFSMVPREEIIGNYHRFRLDILAPEKTEEQILETLTKPIPWVGLMGLVLLTIGFILSF